MNKDNKKREPSELGGPRCQDTYFVMVAPLLPLISLCRAGDYPPCKPYQTYKYKSGKAAKDEANNYHKAYKEYKDDDEQ